MLAAVVVCVAVLVDVGVEVVVTCGVAAVALDDNVAVAVLVLLFAWFPESTIVNAYVFELAAVNPFGAYPTSFK